MTSIPSSRDLGWPFRIESQNPSLPWKAACKQSPYPPKRDTPGNARFPHDHNPGQVVYGAYDLKSRHADRLPLRMMDMGVRGNRARRGTHPSSWVPGGHAACRRPISWQEAAPKPTRRLRRSYCTKMFRNEMPPSSVPEAPLSNMPRQYAPASPVCMNR